MKNFKKLITLLAFIPLFAQAAMLDTIKAPYAYIAGFFAKKETPAPVISTITVGVVAIEGTIEKFQKTFFALKELANNPHIACIALMIDSGGGSPGDSEILAAAIAAIKKTKPVIAFVAANAQSGAYWIASACTTIIATESAHVGSIGGLWETSFKPDTRFVTFKSGIYKTPDLINDNSAYDEKNSVHMQALVDTIATIFITSVANNRNLSPEFVKGLEAKTVLGQEALELGLIDKVGTVDTLIAHINSVISEKNNCTYELLKLVNADRELIATFDLALIQY